jgi:methylphosphotriester-DNA--protein-cysteine methyltransferase
MNLYVKSMVSLRCKMAIQEVLKKLGFHEVSIDLGKVVIEESLTPNQKDSFRQSIRFFGLELIDDKREVIVERIKNVVTEMVYHSEEAPLVNFSVFLSSRLGYDYIYLANLFSDLNGCTLEHYVIANKIERVKELLLEDEMNLSEISYLMHYSSVSHLSAQFKKETGYTPSCFKNNGDYAGRQFVECI